MFLVTSSPAATTHLPEAAGFGARPDISARSVLVTIFGDSVVPAGGEIWLGDLIELCRPFGFNERLVRTSLFRLGAEGWFEVERVGRRSRYRLTPWAIGEFAAAEARIYGRPATPWDGQWTIVLLDALPVDRPTFEGVRDALAGVGFAFIAPGVMGHPRAGAERVARALEQAGHSSAPVAVGRARFDGLNQLTAAGWLTGAFHLAPVAERYQAFVDRYQSLAPNSGPAPASAGGEEAFALRTMVVHELRRARLSDPDLPPELLPADWPAANAYLVGARAYRRLAPAAEQWLAQVTGLTTDPARTAARFPA